MQDTTRLLETTDFPPLRRKSVEILQVNLGYLCNLSCTHCHVNAGPKRTELASLETIEDILSFIRQGGIGVLDITGGAPEMNPHFRYLVQEVRAMSIEVIDRCNLTIVNEPGYEYLGEFLAENKVTITASLPCYQEKNVSEQRGKGVFTSSIEALQKFNVLGYGRHADLKLNLVYNPNGAVLPPDQKQLESAYKKELRENFGVEFNELLTITNMPIKRFGSMLLAKGLYDEYMRLLRENYVEANLHGLMCLNLISVDWQGFVYDCDFNQMLGWPLRHTNELISTDKRRTRLRDLTREQLEGNRIVIGDHCYGCTAGQGSSCGGALS